MYEIPVCCNHLFSLLSLRLPIVTFSDLILSRGLHEAGSHSQHHTIVALTRQICLIAVITMDTPLYHLTQPPPLTRSRPLLPPPLATLLPPLHPHTLSHLYLLPPHQLIITTTPGGVTGASKQCCSYMSTLVNFFTICKPILHFYLF